MAVAGSLTYDTKIDKNGFEKGLNSLEKTTQSCGAKIKNIVTALGIDKLISATFNILNNSIDGAISRLDTLNNYPKVMSNLGIASEKSQKSIKKMSDKLSGLPTTLDEGAMAVQRFTSANSNIEKSTDYFLALNNALLAGGAATDIQSSALEQLSQAYAKGKPDMMEWRSLMTAMPAQLKQVAIAMGYPSTDALGEALRKGEVSMDVFMDKIVELNEKGTGEFQSFEEQARNSTGGIATSITVAKTQVVKGVADIISKIDELLKDNGLGGIGEIISNIGKKAKEVLDIIAERLPSIIRFLKQISPLLVGVVAGLTAYKTILIAIQAVKFVQGIIGTVSAFISLIPAIKSVKDAMLLLNMAFSLNPITIIVGAIAALIAILVVLYNKSETFRNSVNKAFETIKNSILKAWEKIKPALKKLGETLGKILERLAPVGEILVNVLGKAFELLGNILAFIIDILAEVIVEFVNFVNSLIVFFTETIPNAFKGLLDKISQIGNAIGTFFENLWNGIVSFFTETIPQWIQNVIECFANLPYMIGYQIGQILGNIIKFGLDVWNWITTELPQIIHSIINWFAELPGNIWTWLCDTVSKIAEWGQNVYNTAVTWISNTIDGIVNWFAQLPERIATWLTNTINNIVNWGKDMINKGKQAAQELVNNIVNTVKELPGKMLEIGKNLVDGLWNGILGAKDWMINKVKSFAKGIFDGMKNALGIHSPSTLFRDGIGKFIPQGVAVGIEADTDEALKAVNAMNDDIINEMNRAVAVETGSINAKASVKANNSMMNIIQATFNIDGSIEADGETFGRILTPHVTRTLRTAGGI